MKTKIEPRTGQIFEALKRNKEHGIIKGKLYLYDTGTLRTYTTRNVTEILNGDQLLEMDGLFERSEICPFCDSKVYDSLSDKEINSDGYEHDGIECAHLWDAKTKGYCPDCNADLESDGSCPKCDNA